MQKRLVRPYNENGQQQTDKTDFQLRLQEYWECEQLGTRIKKDMKRWGIMEDTLTFRELT